MKKVLSILLILILICSLCACGNTEDSGEPTKIKFTQSIEDLEALKNKTVEINGFMSMLSPLNGELIYLMNMPMQNCPFCIPNTTTLSNTIAVQSKNIEFTSKPVKIVGKLVFDNFVDDYGYNYAYRIENATITELDEKEISEQMKIYYTVSENGYVSEVYNTCLYIDEVAYYEEYELTTDMILEYGEIPFGRYEEMHKAITALNTDGAYNDFISLIEKVEETRLSINKDITNKNIENFKNYQEKSGELYQLFTEFISKYEL